MNPDEEGDAPPASLSDLMVDHLIIVHALAVASDDAEVASIVRVLLHHIARTYAPERPVEGRT